jgi:hypothetical protein
MIRPRFSLRALWIVVSCLAIGFGFVRAAFGIGDAAAGVFVILGIMSFGAAIGAALGAMFGGELECSVYGALAALVATVFLVLLLGWLSVAR